MTAANSNPPSIANPRNQKKLAFLVQLPMQVSPGQRFRCENWIPYLQEAGFSIDYFPFMDEAAYQVLYSKGHFLKKTMGTLKGFSKRITLLFSLKEYAFIFIQREATPIGPPLIEWVIAKVLRKKIIFDFDDAIWIPQSNNPVYSALKCYWKTAPVCHWSYKVAAGNAFLASYAKKYNRQTVVMPTVVDTLKQHNQQKQHSNTSRVTIGWTGSHSTLKYLHLIGPALYKLSEKVAFDLLIIADRSPEFSLPNVRFLPWKAATEIEDLLQIDIGIMPLENDAWSEGKCGFKLIQYLAVGIPAVASAVGVNKEIIEPGVNGYLCHSEETWINALTTLIDDAEYRQQLGNNGRQKMINEYSIEAHRENMIRLFS